MEKLIFAFLIETVKLKKQCYWEKKETMIWKCLIG